MSHRTADFTYYLPEELIAQNPAHRREDSRLLVLDRDSGSIIHDTFAHIGTYLRGGDVLVANRSRVIPARLAARKETGGAVELLLLRPLEDGHWTALARRSRKLRPGTVLRIEGSDLTAELEARLGEGEWQVSFCGPGDIDAQLRSAGTIPLPPYIHSSSAPADRYQTVYADRDGSVAAPTAGLHFSRELLKEIRERGVSVEYVTLHIGLGTFRPVTTDVVEEHRLHAEWGDIPAEVASALNNLRSSGGRVIAVGTTVTRLLETAWDGVQIRPFRGDTDRFIYPGYRFGAIDALVTNFHLPRSTLLMLVSAFAGRERVLSAYEEAVRERYRFYSFGDAMLIV